jgi:hypothetical protein
MVLQDFGSECKEELPKTLPCTWPINVTHIIVIKVMVASFLLLDDSLYKKMQGVCVCVVAFEIQR